MAFPLRSGRRLAALLLIAAGLIAQTGCHKRTAPPAAAVPAPPPPPPPLPRPEPFTGMLTEINGVQAVISFRHPKLINQDLEKLMTAIPEAAVMRTALEQLAPFGYPEFSEIAPDSNVGVAFLDSGGAGSRQQPVIILFAKLQEGGKIATLLSEQNMTMEKRGAWMLIAKDPGDIAKLPSVNGVATFLEKPQTEDIRIWAGATPALISAIKDKIDARFVASAAHMPDDKRKAALAYIDAGFSFLSQLHSAGLNLSLGDRGIRLAYWLQFKPDSPAGIFLRYKPGPAPAVARSIAANGVAVAVLRQQPQATADLMDSVFNTLLGVDYPSGTARLRSLKASYDTFAAETDGGGAGVFDLDAIEKDGREQLRPRFFYVISGHANADAVHDYFRDAKLFDQSFSLLIQHSLMPRLSGGYLLAVDTHTSYTANALTVDSVSFDSTRKSTTLNGRETSSLIQYIGTAGGNVVIADGPATLEQRLPELLAGKPLPDGIAATLNPDEFGHIEVNGSRLVDVLADAAKLDQGDPDVRAQISNLKAEYKAAGPSTTTIEISQARMELALDSPYKFISATVHLYVYLSAQKFDLRQLFMPATPARRRRRHALPAPQHRPNLPVPAN